MSIQQVFSKAEGNSRNPHSLSARLNLSKVIHASLLPKLSQLAIVVAVPIAVSYGTATSVNAATLWYNGDPDGQGSTPNQTFWVRDRSLLRISLNDFTIPTTDGGWEIDTIWSNNVVFSNSSFSQASWEILTVKPVEGTPIFTYDRFFAGGRSPVTITPTNFQVSGQPVVRVSVSGLNIRLAPGTYWLGVAPFYDAEDTYSYPASAIATTSGANAVGTPPGNNQNSFTQAYGPIFPDSRDYSMGIEGTAVPEPSSILGVLTFGAILGFQQWRKQKFTPDAKDRTTH